MSTQHNRLQEAHEFVSSFHDAMNELEAVSTKTAIVAMVERTYETQRRTRSHLMIGTIAMGQSWRYLKHTLAINTVNLPFTMNYRAQAVIQQTHKLSVPYAQLAETDLYVGADCVRDHVWDLADELLENNRVGVTPFPILLDHFESMVDQAKEIGWNIA